MTNESEFRIFKLLPWWCDSKHPQAIRSIPALGKIDPELSSPFLLTKKKIHVSVNTLNKTFYYCEKKFTGGIMEVNPFKDIVLPSVDLPYKPTYTLPEARKIFDCSQPTLWRMSMRGEIFITPHKKIYCKDLENYFRKHFVHKENVEK